MGADWPALLTAYQAALAEFDRTTAALTAALVDRDFDTDDFPALLAAEERAREAVVLTRMRLVDAWRDTQQDVRQLEVLMARVRDSQV